MANTFVPYDLRVKDLTSASAIVSWELSNVVEFKPGTYYNVYTSLNGTVYVLLCVANTKYASIPLHADGGFVKVTSFVGGMGESAQSTALSLPPIGGTDSTDSTTIAVNAAGEPIKLRATDTGELLISAPNMIVEGVAITGSSTEAKQDDIISDIEAVADQITALATAVDTSHLPKLLRAETTATAVTTDGAWLVLPWKKRSLIYQVTFVKEAGSATQWVVDILNKAPPTTDRNIVWRMQSYDAVVSTRMDILMTVPYINLDDLDVLRIKVTPDIGSDNTFAVIVTGEEAR